jgi:hypothetical protein
MKSSRTHVWCRVVVLVDELVIMACSRQVEAGGDGHDMDPMKQVSCFPAASLSVAVRIQEHPERLPGLALQVELFIF